MTPLDLAGPARILARTLALPAALFVVAGLAGPAVAAGGSPAAHDTVTEDTDADGVTNCPDPLGDADNRHPSGKDRHCEGGGSGAQGRTSSDPDNDGRGPDRPDGKGNGGVDQPDGTASGDQLDQDGNNGCGNDDDFEDDNEGRCLRRGGAVGGRVGGGTTGRGRKTSRGIATGGDERSSGGIRPRGDGDRSGPISVGGERSGRATTDRRAVRPGRPRQPTTGGDQAPSRHDRRETTGGARNDSAVGGVTEQRPGNGSTLLTGSPSLTEVLGVVITRGGVPAGAPNAPRGRSSPDRGPRAAVPVAAAAEIGPTQATLPRTGIPAGPALGVALSLVGYGAAALHLAGRRQA